MFELTTNQMKTLPGKEDGAASPLLHYAIVTISKKLKRCLKDCLCRSSISENKTNEDIHECPVSFNDAAHCAYSLNQMHQML